MSLYFLAEDVATAHNRVDVVAASLRVGHHVGRQESSCRAASASPGAHWSRFPILVRASVLLLPFGRRGGRRYRKGKDECGLSCGMVLRVSSSIIFRRMMRAAHVYTMAQRFFEPGVDKMARTAQQAAT
jgi:hypothetical protein